MSTDTTSRSLLSVPSCLRRTKSTTVSGSVGSVAAAACDAALGFLRLAVVPLATIFLKTPSRLCSLRQAYDGRSRRVRRDGRVVASCQKKKSFGWVARENLTRRFLALQWLLRLPCRPEEQLLSRAVCCDVTAHARRGLAGLSAIDLLPWY